MYIKTAIAAVFLVGLALHSSARADEWDASTDNDDGTGDGTGNVLFHRAEQVHDLAARAGLADRDYYVVTTRALASYQFVVDGMTGDLDLATTGVQRIDPTGTAVLQSAVATDFGGVLSLDWKGTETGVPVVHFIRVLGAACGTSCDGNDRYRVRFYETTLRIPRFNNTGTQATVLQVQNVSGRSCPLVFHFLDDAGTLVSTLLDSIEPNQLLVRSTASILPGFSGTASIAHTCGYGGLSGKAVSVEAATGFTFDTPMLSRP
jgi:hypothetical protein